MIADFGSSRLHAGANSVTVAGTVSPKHTMRHLAIELLLLGTDDAVNSPTGGPAPGQVGKKGVHTFHTKESDVWAFAMVIYVSFNALYFRTLLIIHPCSNLSQGNSRTPNFAMSSSSSRYILTKIDGLLNLQICTCPKEDMSRACSGESVSSAGKRMRTSAPR